VPTTLGYALLGLLARAPRTGYALTQALRDPIGYFWTASHSQVYPELLRLEAAGLVRHRVIDGPGPRDTKSYRITAAGRRSLAQWAAAPLAPYPERDELMLKVFSLWTAAPHSAAELIAQQRAQHVQRLAEYEVIDAEMHAEAPARLRDPTSPQFSSYATLRRGISFEQHALAWCDWLLARLDGSA
jgi:DNA-binding PadR family transcriptional regulator